MRSAGNGLTMAVPNGWKFSGVNGTACMGRVGEDTRRGGDIMGWRRRSISRSTIGIFSSA